MTRQQSRVDGFVPRRAGGQLGDHHLRGAPTIRPAKIAGTSSVQQRSELPVGLRRDTSSAAPLRTDLDDSLKGINLDDPKDAGKKGRRNKKDKKPKSKLRRIIKWVVIIVLLAGLGIGGWIMYKAMSAGSSVFKGSLLDIVKSEPLKQDANGRSNILVLGTSDDDPGHQGADLTDSIMILSVDQKNKNAYMISIPRDLEVQYGETCLTGSRGKINVYFSCVGGGTDNIDDTRAALTKEAGFVGNIVGLDIQYGVNVNYTVMRELVSAVGGITVTIESRDPRGQMDANFDWKCGAGDRKVSRAERLRRCPPNGHFIDYPNGPVNLDAEHALYLAQARGDADNYGFEQSNFDREKNQQKIVRAIREKATSAGVLGDFGKVSGVIDALGNNLRTTFQTNEIRTLASLARDIKDQDIQSINLIDGDDPVMSGNAQPTAGMYQFGPLQALIKKKLSSNPATREGANIAVMNGSGVAGAAQSVATTLEGQGFTISSVTNAPEGKYADVEVYQVGDGMPATKKALESLYKVTAKTTAPPVTVPAGVNFIVIIGKASPSE